MTWQAGAGAARTSTPLPMSVTAPAPSFLAHPSDHDRYTLRCEGRALPSTRFARSRLFVHGIVWLQSTGIGSQLLCAGEAVQEACRGGRYLIFASLNTTCLRATGSYLRKLTLSVPVFFL